MADIAALGFSIDSKPLADANKELDKTPIAAAKAEKAVKDLSASTKELGTTSDATASAVAKVSQAVDNAVQAARRRTQYDIAPASATQAVATIAPQYSSAARAAQQFAATLGGGGGGSSGGGSVAAAAEEASSSVGLMAGRLGALAGGIGVAATAAVAFVAIASRVVDAHDQEIRRLGVLYGSQTLAVRAYADIRTQALATGQAIGIAAEQYERFARATQGLGATTNQTAGISLQVAQLARLGGATPQEQSAAAGTLAAMLKEGVVSARSLEQLLEQMPGAARTIADGLGVSVTQLRLMTEAGKLTNTQVFEAMQAQQANVSEKAKAMGLTLGGLFTNIVTEVSNAAVELYKMAGNIEVVSSKAEAARKRMAANPNRPTRATPRSIFNPAANSADALSQQILAGSFEYGPPDNSNLQAQFQDAQRAAMAQATSQITSAAALASQLDPLEGEMTKLYQQINTVSGAIVLLQTGMHDLSADQAAAQIARLTKALGDLQQKAIEAGNGYSRALDAIQQRQIQGDVGMTPGQRAYSDRTQQLISQGAPSTEAAQTIVDAEQLKKLDDLIQKQAQELTLQTAITQAMKGGKAASDDAAVSMQVLGIAFDQLGNITPELQVKLDVLAETLGKIREQVRAQAGVNAAKPLLDDLKAIAAAQAVVAQGAYAMARAQAQAKADASENGTGKLQMQVFDAKQGLTDASTVQALKQQVDLTSQLAAAAGDVAKQKAIQLDYDIRQAGQQAAPGAAGAIAEQMRAKAAAESALALGTLLAQSRDYVAQQQVEQQAAGLSAEAAARLRFEYDLLNKAKQAGVVLTPAVVGSLRQSAAEMAAAQAKTQRLTDLYNLGRETFRGFFSDLLQGLQRGAGFWDAFGNAATNALNRIASKLLEMAAQNLFDQAFGGGGGGGGLLTFLGLGGGTSIGNLNQQAINNVAGGAGTPGTPPFANGGVFLHGNVVPFAGGGIVRRPTLFPMANGGTGLMGEAGEEGIVPLRRGRNGRLGVDASGVGGGDMSVTINNYADANVSARKTRGPGGQMSLDILVEPIEQKIASRMARGQGPLGKTMQTTFGLQPVGR
jgi:tape measure domain-containing protein